MGASHTSVLDTDRKLQGAAKRLNTLLNKEICHRHHWAQSFERSAPMSSRSSPRVCCSAWGEKEEQEIYCATPVGTAAFRKSRPLIWQLKCSPDTSVSCLAAARHCAVLCCGGELRNRRAFPRVTNRPRLSPESNLGNFQKVRKCLTRLGSARLLHPCWWQQHHKGKTTRRAHL